MIAFVMAMAMADAELATLRYETSRASWSICIDHQLKKMEAGIIEPGVPKAGLVQLAMQQCYDFSQDFKGTLPDIAEGFLKRKGTQHYSRGVVDTLVDGMFQEASDGMRKEKEAQ